MTDTEIVLPTVEAFAEIAPALLSDSVQLDKFVADLRKVSISANHSVGTSEGRAAIKSAAARAARYKTALDNARKSETEGLRMKVKEINDRGNAAVEKIQTLQDELRKPVEEWEKQEKARVESCQAVIAKIDRYAQVSLDDKASEVEARIAELEKLEITPSDFQELWDAAAEKRITTINMLKLAVDRLKKQAAEQAELERLRVEADERAAREETERLAKEEAVRAAEAKAEKERVERERAEAARKQAEEAAARAAEEARLKAEQAAADALAEKERLHQEEIARLQRERDEKDAAERREREAALAREQAQREEDARRQADQEHRDRVRKEAATALLEVDPEISFSVSFRILDAIADGRVPHVTINF